jgi:glucose/arabinose dehydrogenase
MLVKKEENPMLRRLAVFAGVVFSAAAWLGYSASPPDEYRTVGPPEQLNLPKPLATTVAAKRSEVIGWPAGRTPSALPGFQVAAYAEGLETPRQLYVLPNGDVLVTEYGSERGRATGRITLLRDPGPDGKPKVREVFLSGLNLPFGMLLLGNYFYVGNTDGIVRYPYHTGDTRITASGEKILDLPTGGHNTRNLIAKADGSKIYVAVGSSSNVDESGNDARDPRRAAVLEINPDGSGMRVFASGIRNPVGMSWQPGASSLWIVVNERDNLGDELVPDYFTHVREGAFYGWPYSYYGQNEDPRKKGQRPDLVAKAIPPDYALGNHVAPLGLVFYTGSLFPQSYRSGAFIAEHGSWNRSHFNGYRVVYLAFQNGKPSGDPQDFLTGFIANEQNSTVYGRPVGLAVAPGGSLLVADDGGNKVWRVSYAGAGKSASSK